MKKLSTLLLYAVLSVNSTFADIAINETNFPDENFRNYLLTQDYGEDGVLTDAEIASVTNMTVSNQSIKSLQGIEFFTALSVLDCRDNQLDSINLSKNTELLGLACSDNQLTSLDLSQNTMLRELMCSMNQLTSLDLSQNTMLRVLMCSKNQLTSLKVSKNTVLTKLWCGKNKLVSLDVSGCTALEYLGCNSNQLTSLDVSGCAALTYIDCFENQLKGTSMDALVESLPVVNGGELNIISKFSEDNAMTTTQVSAAQVKGWTPYYGSDWDGWEYYAGIEPATEDIAIDETNFPDENFRNWLLAQEYGSDGKLSDAEIAGIISMDVRSLDIKSLQGIEFFTALTELQCGFNQLTSIDVSKNTALTRIDCSSNQLTSLDVSQNTALKGLDCSSNLLTSLDVSQNTALKGLNCSFNQLTSLDVSKNIALTDLWCSFNKLTSIDLTNNIALTVLICSNNHFSALNVSGCTALTGLDCYGNQLTSLDVSGCVALTELNCCDNQIKGTAMDAFVEGLPTVSNGVLLVIAKENEQNMMTTIQVAVAKAKGWIAYLGDDFEGWEEYHGPKCATPTIAFTNGKLQLECDTKDAIIVSKVTCADAGEYEGTSVPFATTYNITTYAKKDGYINSDVATKEINISGGAGGIRGDVNNDGQVSMPDAMFIVNRILNGKFPDE